MATEGLGVSAEDHRVERAEALPQFGLRACLVDGDAEQRRREGKVRRRALLISTFLQALVLLAVIAVPFFGKVERIALANVMPLPPYHPLGSGTREHMLRSPRNPGGARNTFCFACAVTHRASNSSGTERSNSLGPTGLPDGSWGEPAGNPCLSGCIAIRNNDGPLPPPSATPSVVHITHLDPAMLIDRIEPAYPALARQIHREGRVELRATIGTDGRVESLQVVSGDALFYSPALEAVRRWRYRPTMLNGKAVQVDTYISVIYTLR